MIFAVDHDFEDTVGEDGERDWPSTSSAMSHTVPLSPHQPPSRRTSMRAVPSPLRCCSSTREPGAASSGTSATRRACSSHAFATSGRASLPSQASGAAAQGRCGASAAATRCGTVRTAGCSAVSSRTTVARDGAWKSWQQMRRGAKWASTRMTRHSAQARRCGWTSDVHSSVRMCSRRG